MSIFKNITSKFFFLALLFAGIILVSDLANVLQGGQSLFDFGFSALHAAPQAQPEQSSSMAVFNQGLDTTVKVINAILGIITVLVSPFIMFAGWLMTPDWVTGDLFGLNEPIYKLWVTVSNILYFFYAILLIIIAIATIFNSQNYGYKALLPRLIVGICMIPLSFFFVREILSLSTVATSAVLELPYETIAKFNEGDQKNTWWNRPSIPKVITVDTFTTSFDTISSNCEKDPSICISPKNFLDKSGGMYSPIMIYAYSVFKIQNVKALNGGIDVAMSMLSIAIDGLISAIMFIIFGAILIALIAILFLRVFSMWLYMIFSPLFSLKFVLGKEWKDGSDYFDIGQFIATAFVPAVIGLTLSFGLIIIAAVSDGINGSTASVQQKKCDAFSSSGCTVLTLMGDTNNTLTKRIVEGRNNNQSINPSSVTDASGKTTQELTTLYTVNFGGEDGVKLNFYGTNERGIDVESLKQSDWNLGRLGTMLVQFIAIVVIWVAFTMVGKISKVASKVVDKFEGIGKTIGGGAVKSIPVPFVGNLGGLERAQTALSAKMRSQGELAYANSTVGTLLNASPPDEKVNQQMAKVQKYKNITDYDTKDKVGVTEMKQTANITITSNVLNENGRRDHLKEMLKTLQEALKTAGPTERSKVVDSFEMDPNSELAKAIRNHGLNDSIINTLIRDGASVRATLEQLTGNGRGSTSSNNSTTNTTNNNTSNNNTTNATNNNATSNNNSPNP